MAESFLVHMSFEPNAGGRSETHSAASSGVVVAEVAEAFGEATISFSFRGKLAPPNFNYKTLI